MTSQLKIQCEDCGRPYVISGENIACPRCRTRMSGRDLYASVVNQHA